MAPYFLHCPWKLKAVVSHHVPINIWAFNLHSATALLAHLLKHTKKETLPASHLRTSPRLSHSVYHRGKEDTTLGCTGNNQTVQYERGQLEL